MYFHETIALTASSAAATTYATDYVTGEVASISFKTITMSTSKDITLGYVGKTSSLNFLATKMMSSEKMYYPRAKGHTPTAGTSFVVNIPISLCSERIKVWVQSTSSSAKKTATLHFHFQGTPGEGSTG